MAWAPKVRMAEKQSEYRKPEHSRLYHSAAWGKASKAYRAANPLCAECERNGVVRAAECVDHIEPHKGDLVRFWSVENWQSLCDKCHSEKTRRGE